MRPGTTRMLGEISMIDLAEQIKIAGRDLELNADKIAARLGEMMDLSIYITFSVDEFSPKIEISHEYVPSEAIEIIKGVGND